jgi:hypothetical protein
MALRSANNYEAPLNGSTRPIKPYMRPYNNAERLTGFVHKAE